MYSEINKLMAKEDASQYVYVLIHNDSSQVWGVYTSIGRAFEEFYNTRMSLSAVVVSEYEMDIDDGDVLIGTDLTHEGPDFVIQRIELNQ